jgi:AcrR family transcriptional regulator
MPHRPLLPEQLKLRILEAATAVMKDKGLEQTTRSLIALKADCATGSINVHYGTMEGLRTALVMRAMRRQDAEALALMVSFKEYKKMMAPGDILLAAEHIAGITG